MNISSTLWIGSDLTDAEYGELALQLVGREDLSLLPNMLVLAERHPDFWPTEQGQAVLAGMLGTLVDTLDAGDVAGPLAAIQACPASIAEQAYNLLLLAFFPKGAGNPADLDDAAILALALLLGASGRGKSVAAFLGSVKAGRVESYFAPKAKMIASHFAPAETAEKFKPKLIIWDLDDTLWTGTLADGDDPVLNETRAGFVRALNTHGIVSAICSKNDHAAARARLEAMGMWDQFVFPRIAFVPKGAVVKAMIEDMQLRPANTLFIDDNPHNLREVADSVPGIRTLDATSPECDAFLAQMAADHAHIDKNRIADYRVLETRIAERQDNELSDEAFLIQSGIHATFTDRMDNLEFADRMEELVNRSNQLNYTQSRIEPGTLRDRIQDIDHYETLSAFVWDKYGYYGLVGVAVYAFRTRTLEHFAFSCRIMHMGVEDAMIRHLAERGYSLDATQFRKPLPPQSAKAITTLPYADTKVRARILSEEAPRDWSKVQLRIMADCQSGAFHHYSRHRDAIDFDNAPRVFSLPQMLTGETEGQHFPRYLVYTAASDYVDWRWKTLSLVTDLDIFKRSVAAFEEMVVKGDHKILLFLPPQDLPVEMFELHVGCDSQRSHAIHPALNDIWREVAKRHPNHFTLIELADMLAPDELVHAHHYVPSALKRMAGAIDDWFETETATD